MGTPREVRASRWVAASPQRVFDLLADPAMHPVLDGSGTVRAARPGGPSRLSLGARFGMDMRMGVPYRMHNTVIVFDEPRHIAWRHLGHHEWHYALEPADGGTMVTEWWDPSPMGPLAVLPALFGFPARNQRAIEATLERLAARFA